MSVTRETYYGGASYASFGVTRNLERATRVQVLEPTTSGLSLYLPDATRLAPGTRYYVINASGTHSFDVADAEGVALITVPAGYGGIFALVVNGSASGRWNVHQAGAVGDGGATPGGNLAIRYVVPQDTMNLDAYDAAVLAGWDESRSIDLTIVIPGGVRVGSVSTATPSLEVPNTFPAGSTVTISLIGRVQGAGGTGGDGGATETSNGADGGDGGDAILLSWPTLITGTGLIIGGGGGGGGAGGQPNVIPNGSSKGGGGGGGSGFGGCVAGTSYGSGDTNYQEASWGNPGAGGAGGVGGSATTPSPTQTGGAGGGLGQDGADGEASTGGTPPTTGGAGGTAGYAIVGTSLLDGASGGYTTYGGTTP